MAYCIGRSGLLPLLFIAVLNPLNGLSAQTPCPDEGLGVQLQISATTGSNLDCGSGAIAILPPGTIPGTNQQVAHCPTWINVAPAYMTKKSPKVGYKITGTQNLSGVMTIYDCNTTYILWIFPWDTTCRVKSSGAFGGYIHHTAEAVCTAPPPGN
jgi:hypothetical protein